jgi:hypothetical protein
MPREGGGRHQRHRRASRLKDKRRSGSTFGAAGKARRKSCAVLCRSMTSSPRTRMEKTSCAGATCRPIRPAGLGVWAFAACGLRSERPRTGGVAGKAGGSRSGRGRVLPVAGGLKRAQLVGVHGEVARPGARDGDAPDRGIG